MEIWKNYGNTNYQFSNTGKVKSTKKNKILKPQSNGNGYEIIRIWREGLGEGRRFEQVYIHRIVASLFIENPQNKKYVNHKDFNKKNNNVSNLEWVTAKENTQHAFLNGVLKSPPTRQGEDHPTSKLTALQVQSARYLYPDFTIKEISIILGVSWCTISHIVKNKTWKNIINRNKCL